MRAMLSRFGSLSEGKGAVPVDFGLKTFLTHRFLDEIDFAAEDSGKTTLKLAEATDVIQPPGREVLAKAHSQVHIVRGSFPAGDGAEQGGAQHAGGTEFGFVCLQGGYHLVSLHETNLA